MPHSDLWLTSFGTTTWNGDLVDRDLMNKSILTNLGKSHAEKQKKHNKCLSVSVEVTFLNILFKNHKD